MARGWVQSGPMNFGAHGLLGFIPIQGDFGYLTSVKTKQMPHITLKRKQIKAF